MDYWGGGGGGGGGGPKGMLAPLSYYWGGRAWPPWSPSSYGYDSGRIVLMRGPFTSFLNCCTFLESV